MILLLDTCALLWFLSNDPQLSVKAKTAIEEPTNVRWTSPISLLEIAHRIDLTGRESVVGLARRHF